MSDSVAPDNLHVEPAPAAEPAAQVEPAPAAEPAAQVEPAAPVAAEVSVAVAPSPTPSPSADEVALPNDLDVRLTKIHIATLLDAVSKVLDGRSLTKGNVIRVAFAVMHVSQKLPVKGALKKEALLTALDIYLARDKSLSQDEKDMLLAMVHGVVSMAIDAHYSDVKGELKPLVGAQSCCVVL